jgi:starvation-inducible DNA-binding protein
MQIIGILQQRLADAIDVMLQTKQAHWNVKGLNFYSLHLLFDQVHDEIEEGVDLLAERITQLGGIAEGVGKSVIQRSKMPEYPLSAATGIEHVLALSNTLSAYAETIRKGIQECDNLDDLTSADIFTEISRVADKSLWMVEAHVQEHKNSSQKEKAA